MLKTTHQGWLVDEEQQIVLVKEMHPTSASETIGLPYSGCAAKCVQVPRTLTTFRDFEISEGLGLRHEDRVHLTVICPKICLPFNSATEDTAFIYSEYAAELSRKHTAGLETVAFQSLFQSHSVGVSRLRWRKGGWDFGTITFLRSVRTETRQAAEQDPTEGD
ncbi:MAG: hypothetical protein DMG97_16400 [Acidobacteria bacterium]|nr:MAG: hypothetical protein DMG97_16400 [Acidobacteriota bacterium]